MNNRLEQQIERIKRADTLKQYDTQVQKLNLLLKESDYPLEVCQEIQRKQKYVKNIFSDEANREKMLEAKEKLLQYLEKLQQSESGKEDVEKIVLYLKNFYLFLEALTESIPDRRSKLQRLKLQEIKIQNEYDLQHLLYAVLKPFVPDIRKEVSEDSGVGTVRTDFKIEEIDLAIEAKCTRESIGQKKLTEEIEADIIHYQEKNILFYVYDKEKMIKDKQNYEKQFNRQYGDKNVRMIVQQPVIL